MSTPLFRRGGLVRLTIHGDVAVRQQLQAIGRQAPYALSVALNNTANAVQSAVRDSLSDRFTLRRKTFVENTIYRQSGVDWATKTKPQATVRVRDTPDSKGRVPDFLAQHEDGGTKTPRDGRSIAIPLPGARRNKGDIVTVANRPRALLAKKQAFRKDDLLLKRTGRGKRAKLTALFVFKRSVRIRPRLGMEATAERVVPDVWERIAGAAIDRALATAK